MSMRMPTAADVTGMFEEIDAEIKSGIAQDEKRMNEAAAKFGFQIAYLVISSLVSIAESQRDLALEARVSTPSAFPSKPSSYDDIPDDLPLSEWAYA